MKMISSTSTTSTSGTILISESVPLPAPKRRRPNPPRAPLPLLIEKAIWVVLALEHPLRCVQEFERKVLHPRAHHLYAVAEIVVKHRCGDGGEQAQRSSEERIGNAGGNRSHTGGTGQTQCLERLDDAENRSEQANKRRDSSGGGQPAHIALQLCNLFADAKLQGALQGQRIGDTASLGYLAMYFAIAEIEHRNQRRGCELLAGGGDGVHALRLTKRPEETLVGRTRPTESKPFREDHGPGEQRKSR